VPSLIKGRPNNNTNNNNKAKCIPGGTLRVLAGKNNQPIFPTTKQFELSNCFFCCFAIKNNLILDVYVTVEPKC
jgi:hypothetical protein